MGRMNMPESCAIVRFPDEFRLNASLETCFHPVVKKVETSGLTVKSEILYKVNCQHVHN